MSNYEVDRRMAQGYHDALSREAAQSRLARAARQDEAGLASRELFSLGQLLEPLGRRLQAASDAAREADSVAEVKSA